MDVNSVIYKKQCTMLLRGESYKFSANNADNIRIFAFIFYATELICIKDKKSEFAKENMKQMN